MGFIGSHLVDRLVELGHDVTVIDDLSNGYLANQNEKAHFIYGNARFYVFQDEFDVVYNLACYPRSISFNNPVKDLESNYEITLKLCQQAATHKFHIIFSSNSGLVGNPEKLPITEETPANPLTPYDLHKYASEMLLRLYSNRFGFPVTVFRFAAVYGPRQRSNPTLGWKPLIAEWIQRTLKDEEIILEGDGNQTRDFIYVDDIVDALILSLQQIGSIFYGPYLLASSEETSLNRVLSYLPTNHYKMVHLPRKPGDIDRMSYDISKAKQELGWMPQVTFNNGIRETIKWWQSQ